MRTEMVVVVGIAAFIAILCVVVGVVYYLRETGRERRRWATYSDYRSGEPKSRVCPACRTRIYSLRAIREQRCIQCGADWAVAGADRTDRAT